MKNKNISSAFTLIELLVTITIIGILSGVSVSTYGNYIERSKTAEAESNAERICKKEILLCVEEENCGTKTYDSCYGREMLAANGGGGGYPDLSEWTPDNCFTFSGGAISNYDPSQLECEADIIIPENIGGIAVASIEDYAFYSNDLTSVTIPDSVTSIGLKAFGSNDLTSVTIPDSVTSMGYHAFASNDLISVTIPNSLTSIAYKAFAFNDLTSVTIPDSVTSIESSAFQYNDLTSVTIPDSVSSIGASAFASNDLTAVTILDSVSSIGASAFYSNSLTSVTIPDSVTSIGNAAFFNNGSSKNSGDITDFVPGTNQTWHLSGTTWVKQ